MIRTGKQFCLDLSPGTSVFEADNVSLALQTQKNPRPRPTS